MRLKTASDERNQVSGQFVAAAAESESHLHVRRGWTGPRNAVEEFLPALSDALTYNMRRTISVSKLRTHISNSVIKKHSATPSPLLCQN